MSDEEVEVEDKDYDLLDHSFCKDCYGEMTWCTSCEEWTKLCCEEYGTCMCS